MRPVIEAVGWVKRQRNPPVLPDSPLPWWERLGEGDANVPPVIARSRRRRGNLMGGGFHFIPPTQHAVGDHIGSPLRFREGRGDWRAARFPVIARSRRRRGNLMGGGFHFITPTLPAHFTVTARSERDAAIQARGSRADDEIAALRSQ